MHKFCFLVSIDLSFKPEFLKTFFNKFSKHITQKHTCTIVLSLLKKKNEHEVLVIFKDLKKLREI